MKDKLIRDKDGNRYRILTELPPVEVRKQAAQDVAENLKRKKIYGVCPGCNNNTGVASDVKSILKHGLCVPCQQFADGKRKDLVWMRGPTIDEVFEAYANGDVRMAEEAVALRLFAKTMKNNPEGLKKLFRSL